MSRNFTTLSSKQKRLREPKVVYVSLSESARILGMTKYEAKQKIEANSVETRKMFGKTIYKKEDVLTLKELVDSEKAKEESVDSDKA